MIRVMLVDDELLVRMGIKMLVDWEAEGFFLAGEAANGREALDIWQTIQPDIIITDILMPEKNGIELMKDLREQNYSGLIAILSNHDDFDYTREAMRNGACDYILKSDLNKDNFRQFLLSVSEKLENRLHQSIQDRNPLLLQNSLKEFIFAPSSKSRERKSLCLPEGYEDLSYRVSILQIKDANTDSHQKYKIYQLATGILTPDKVFFYDGSQESMHWILLFYGNSDELYDDLIRLKFRQLQSALKTYIHTSVFIAVGEITKDPNYLYMGYQKVKNILWQSFFHTTQICCFQKDPTLQSRKDENVESFYNDTEKLLAPAHSREEIELRLNNLFEEILRRKDASLLKYLALRAADVINQKHTKRAVENPEFNPSPFQTETLWKHGSPEELKELLLENLSALNSRGNDLPIALISRTLSYLDDHLASPLTLSEVAEHTGLSRTYFSSWFKDKTEEKFSDYLSKRRIERAKDLLIHHPEYRIYEIASLAGFQNEKYFSRIFKTMTSVSPRDYRNRIHEIII
ncbi:MULTISPECIES: response regulator [unclassified Oceanispirochaeta]|uniref:response regulator transcription factor n=1 Tax=unclassified Oceanispirochaeta TaxID=2635722 RepID=UPI000E08E180|nr:MULTISPECIES: response regulator [unclassified Oceanispirochaeta]MBF9015374.1 response regulator [Oceanispirochaeta sp. M2]NPD71833.1 response regulator [Oceanispirochaeta sp. M1]RDG32644.1 response regulator [Oceanispirochaeta sp. M1]